MRTEIAGKHCNCDHCVQHGDSAQTYTENCASTVYKEIVTKKAAKCLILLEAGTGIEPVYTDLQSEAFASLYDPRGFSRPIQVDHLQVD